ncbi:MAG: acetate--CoA ligase family protein, partial [Thermoleophilia bacterium]|nr:acetate--CoA ligase family protein [Gaiellaceae bacterium]MDW8339611.1 acetate--CoA ligase family protein [Thermoleophilia bacterium]
DHAEAAGIPFAPLPDALAGELSRAFPNFLAPGNPLDAWAIADERVVYPRSLELMAASGAFDILLAQADLSQFRDPTNEEWCELTLRTLGRLASQHEDLVVAMTTVHSADPPRRFQELARELDVPLLRGARDSLRALAAVSLRPRWHRVTVACALPPVAELLRPGALPEHESALVLERYGVPFAERRRAAAVDDAVEAAKELGFPVVVKRDGPAHKAREGGVVLGLETPEAVADATSRLGPPVLVARQVSPGVEVLCGMTRDPSYGPILAVGAGGRDVEELDRVALCAAPVERAVAAELVAEAGVEDPHGVVSDTLVALSRLASAHPEIVSIDVNPLIVSSDETVAVDALVVVAD